MGIGENSKGTFGMGSRTGASNSADGVETV